MKERKPRLLIQVTAPHFCAGLIVHRGIVVKTAPILAWTKKKRWVRIKRYIRRKKWAFTVSEQKIGGSNENNESRK